MRRPAACRKDRGKFVSGKTKQNAVKSMILTDAEGRVVFCSPVRPGSCAGIAQARQLGLTQLLAGLPGGHVQLDFVFNERLPEAPRAARSYRRPRLNCPWPGS